jgi:hypothetical protein
LCCWPGCLPCQQIFRKTSKLFPPRIKLTDSRKNRIFMDSRKNRIFMDSWKNRIFMDSRKNRIFMDSCLEYKKQTQTIEVMIAGMIFIITCQHKYIYIFIWWQILKCLNKQ